jgi:dTDP-4-amino-4,6-dideoxygalactose transaminase
MRGLQKTSERPPRNQETQKAPRTPEGPTIWLRGTKKNGFQAVKNLPTADSGMICFKNEDYDNLVRKLSWLGIDKDTYQRTTDKGSYRWEYDIVDVGYKYNGNSIMASMAIVGLKYLDEDNKRRREICDLYDKYFENNTTIKIVKNSEITKIPSKHLYQIIVPNRNQIMEYLNTHGIYPGVHYRDNTKYTMYGYGNGTCPNAHKLSEQLISLPLHLKLTDEDVSYVANKVLTSLDMYI